MTTLKISTPDVDFESVGLALNQAALPAFVFPNIPSVTVLGTEDGYSGTVNYELVKLSYAMQNGGGSALWRAGTDPGDSEAIPTDSIQVKVYGKRSSVKQRNLASQNPRLADLKRKWESQLSQLYTGMEYDLSSFLRNTSVYGSAQTFTGSALSTIDVANQDPIGDIETALNAKCRLYPFPGRFKTVAIMDVKTLDTLRRRPEYHGAGTGSNRASILPRDAFIDTFMSAHRLDEVWVIGTKINTAADGATKVVGNHTPILWMGNIDKQAEGTDLTVGNQDSESNPDGALCMAMTPQGVLHRQKEDSLLGVERHMVTAEYGFFAPRGSAMACFWTGSDITA